MIRQLAALIAFGTACLAAEPKPILIVLDQDPWSMVIGSDSPTFAVYEDGSVVYLRDKPSTEVPFNTRSVENPQRLVSDIVRFDMSKVQEFYELSSATDQPSTMIWTPSKTIVIYGDWRKPHTLGWLFDRRFKAANEETKKKFGSLPEEIRQALRRVGQQRTIKGSAWLPAKIEVMFWPYEYAPEESIRWPESWPDLKAENTKLRGEDLYCVYLPSKHLEALRQLLATRKEKGAVLINGKKMAVSYRFPFPGESGWMRPRNEQTNQSETSAASSAASSAPESRQP